MKKIFFLAFQDSLRLAAGSFNTTFLSNLTEEEKLFLGIYEDDYKWQKFSFLNRKNFVGRAH